jgi:hypothetical protein
MTTATDPLPSRRTLLWPLIIAAVLVVPPLLFCVIFFRSLGDGHPPALIIPMLYVFFTSPVLAPLGLYLSVRAIRRQARPTWLAWVLAGFFLLLTLPALAWLVRYLVVGTIA